MTIERDKEDIVIRVDASLIGLEDVQKFANYLRLIESNAKNQGTEEQAAELAYESHKNWLKENGHSFTNDSY